ncbi:VCBS domain-containing protein [Pseudovibrio japonicus]|uniref:VCBS domain-containing protein n=1 Tax=Pseudovibrio japonicus TaxID=366534 RepID=UPI001FD13F2B
MTITGANDAPVVSDIATSTSEDDKVLIEPVFTDVDSADTHTITFDTSSTTGEVSLVDGKFQYNPNGQFEHLAVGEMATDSFTYTVDDGNGDVVTKTVTVTVNGANDAPVFVTSTVAIFPEIVSPSDGQHLDRFGNKIVVNANGTLVVAAPLADDGPIEDAGALYIYQKNELGEYIEQKIVAPDREPNDAWGQSVAINNQDMIAWGATGDDVRGENSGSVYVYQPTGSGSSRTLKLTAPDGEERDAFGVSVALNNNGLLVVGARNGDDDEDDKADVGALYIYEIDSGGRYSTTKLATGLEKGDALGISIAVNDIGTIVAGAPYADFGGSNQGAVYVYNPNGDGNYSRSRILIASDRENSDLFGSSVAVSETGIIVVGAPYSDYAGDQSGAAYVYMPDDQGGYVETKLIVSDAEGLQRFGGAVAINSNGVVVVGAETDIEDGALKGSAYVFVPNLIGGYTEYKLVAPDARSTDYFGKSVAIDDNGIVTIGANQAGENRTGTVYVFQPDEDGTYIINYKDGPSNAPSTEFNLFETTDTFPITQSLQLSFTDVDVSDDAHTASITDVSATGVTSGLSSLSDDDLKALLSVTGVTSSAASVEGSIDLTFSAASTVFDYLAVGEQVELVFTVTLDDGNGGIATQPVTVTIVGTNDAPIVSDIAASTPEDDSVLIEPAYIDPDASDAATITFDASSTTGEVSLVNGTFQYNPNGQFEHLAVGETATDTFTYTVSDGTAEPVTRTVTVTITGANDAPVVSDIATSTSEDDSVLIDPVFTDVDSADTHTITFDASGTTGEVSLVDSKFRYNPNGQFEHLAVGETATDNFTYTVDDGNGGVVTKTATITINGANDVPVIVATQVQPFIDTFVASDGRTSVDHFGWSVGINASGVLVVGARLDDDRGKDSGSAYVYAPDGSGGVKEIKLTAFDGARSDNLGRSVAVNDAGVIVVGAPGDDPSGSVYVYTPDGSGGYEQIKLTAPDGAEGDYFGYSLAVNDTGVIVVGAHGDDDWGSASGSVYVYVPDGAGGYSNVKLIASDGAQHDTFGYSVAISDTGLIAVGAYADDDREKDSGSVYVYVPDGSEGYEQIKLTAPDGAESDYFGSAVAVNDVGIVVVGSYKNHVQGEHSGSVYVYAPDDSGGHTHVKLTASDGAISNWFGRSVAVNDDGVIVVGASSAVYVFVPDEQGGYTEYKLAAPEGAYSGGFGISVAISSSGEISVGDYDRATSASNAGAVYVFKPDAFGAYGVINETLGLQDTNDLAPVSGQIELIFSDVDTTGSDYEVSVTDVSVSGSSGNLESDVLLGLLGVDHVERAADEAQGSVHLVFSAPATLFDYLSSTDSIKLTYTVVLDGGPVSQQVSVVINGTNDAPIVSDIITSTSEDDGVLIEPVFSDVDLSDTHIVTFDASGTTGEVSHLDGKFFYDPNGQFEHLAVGETANDSFTYTIDDGNGGSVTKTATITIIGANDAPVASDVYGFSYMVDDGNGGMVMKTVLATEENSELVARTIDTSPTGETSVFFTPEIIDVDITDQISLAVDDSETIGSVVLEDGKFKYDQNGQFEHLAPGELATDTFSYTVSDNYGGQTTRTIQVVVHGHGNHPTLSSVSISDDGRLELVGTDGGVSISGTSLSEFIRGGDGFDTVGYRWSESGVTVNLGDPSQNAGDAASDSYESIEYVAGSDAFADHITGDANHNRIWGYGGDDKLYGAGGDDYLYGGEGADYMDGGTGRDFVRYSDSDAAVHVDLASGAVDGGYATGDVLVNVENVEGSQFDDVLIGDDNANNLYGVDGNDHLEGGDGADVLNGHGSGADYLDGGSGEDTVRYYWSEAGVTVNLEDQTQNSGDASGDTYVSIEHISGSNSYADILIGDTNHNKIRGNGGDDKLYGAGGDDYLYGGEGADYIDGGTGRDFVRYSDSDAAVHVDLASGAVDGGYATGDVLVNIENVEGSQFDDVLIGDDNANNLYGVDGNDHLEGGAGADVLNGHGSGADYLDGGSGEDTVRYYWSEAGVTVNLEDQTQNSGDASGDTYVSIEHISGSDTYADKLIGDAHNNTIRGNGGDDILDGGSGNDLLIGGIGSDTFVFGGTTFGNDVIADFAAVAGDKDVIQLDTNVFADFDALLAATSDEDGNVVIMLDDSNSITLNGVSKSDLHQDDFLFI